jgi:hypothetical protein
MRSGGHSAPGGAMRASHGRLILFLMRDFLNLAIQQGANHVIEVSEVTENVLSSLFDFFT